MEATGRILLRSEHLRIQRHSKASVLQLSLLACVSVTRVTNRIPGPDYKSHNKNPVHKYFMDPCLPSVRTKRASFIEFPLAYQLLAHQSEYMKYNLFKYLLNNNNIIIINIYRSVGCNILNHNIDLVKP